MTSFQAVAGVRRLVGGKCGHGGTLDPQATGVLPILLGSATRIFDYLALEGKQYLAEVRFGIETDTQDAQGKIVSRSQQALPGAKQVAEALACFVGDIWQTPPAYSAIKINGRRSYDLARRQAEVALAPRRICIQEAAYVAQMDESRHLLRIRCSKGTYIRTICRDLGRQLGCGAHMSFLLRQQVGQLHVADAVALEALAQTRVDQMAGAPFFLPLERALGHLKALQVQPAYWRALYNGASLDAQAVGLMAPGIEDELALLLAEGQAVCISRWRQGRLHCRTMLRSNQ